MELKDGLARPGKGQLAEELIQVSDWLPHCIIVANQREVEGRNGSSWLLQLPECLLRPREKDVACPRTTLGRLQTPAARCFWLSQCRVSISRCKKGSQIHIQSTMFPCDGHISDHNGQMVINSNDLWNAFDVRKCNWLTV